jgi:serine/alanine adding enzyme
MSIGDPLIRVHFRHEPLEGLPSPDVYFLQGYGRASSITGDNEWVLLEAFDGAWQVPLVLRTIVDGAKDAISPYGYSGVYASPSLSSSQVQKAWSATINSLKDLGVISVLFRHSPLVPQATDLPELRSIIRGHPTIALEPADSDSAWSGMAGACRTAIRKALKNGYTGNVRQASALDLEPDGDFRRLYEHTMSRLHAATLYSFGDEYYSELLKGLGANLLIADVRDPAGAAISSALFMRHGQRLHYHLSGSNADNAGTGSNNLMLWTATQYAIEQGLRQFHLGGGISQRDGLFRFKHAFGGRELGYDVSGLIIDHELYQTRTENRAQECGISADALLRSNYFPAYRGGTDDSFS